MSHVPYARARWNEIIPGLWQGGHDFEPTGNRSAWPKEVVVDREFDLVVSVYLLPDSGPAHDVEHVVFILPDGPLEDYELRAVRRLADRVAAAVADGRKVLVRCEMGYNRSGLVVGFALLRRGHTAEQAVRLIRQGRGAYALSNPRFLEYISDEYARIAATRP
jgi:protein-tyrosine phosphatase